MNESDGEDERGVGSDSQDQTRIWWLFFAIRSNPPCFLLIQYACTFDALAVFNSGRQTKYTLNNMFAARIRSVGTMFRFAAIVDLVDKTTTNRHRV